MYSVLHILVDREYFLHVQHHQAHRYIKRNENEESNLNSGRKQARPGKDIRVLFINENAHRNVDNAFIESLLALLFTEIDFIKNGHFHRGDGPRQSSAINSGPEGDDSEYLQDISRLETSTA